MQTNVSAYQADSLVQVSRIVVIVWIVGVVLADTLIRRIDPLIESRLTSAHPLPRERILSKCP